MKAVRENVEKALELLALIDNAKNRDADEVLDAYSDLHNFIEDCKNWLPPERDYNRVMEHRSKKESDKQ